MRTATALFLCTLLTTIAYGQQTEYIFSVPTSPDFKAAYSVGTFEDGNLVGAHSGSRGVTGPFDLDGDGKSEVLLTDYTGGGRVHVIENIGVDTWELVYSTPWVDSTASVSNARYATGGDLDNDGNQEILFIAGNGYGSTTDAAFTFGLYVYEFTGTDNDFGTLPASINPLDDTEIGPPSSGYGEILHALDIDGDNFQEVLIPINGPSSHDQFYVYSVSGTFEPNGLGTTFETWVQEFRVGPRENSNLYGGGSAIAMYPADLNGDGTSEISLHSWNNYNFFNAQVAGADNYVLPDATNENRFLRAAPYDNPALLGGTVVDINQDGDDEVFYPVFDFGTPAEEANINVSLLNYEEGEDVLSIAADNFLYNFLGPVAEIHLGSGDLDGDGNMELLGTGEFGYPASDYNDGIPHSFLHVAEFTGGVGGDPEDPNNYTIDVIDTSSPVDTLGFNVVYRDSLGTTTKFYETNGGGFFASRIANLGDVDDDGFTELAFSFQGIDDTLTVFDEMWMEDVGEATWSITTDDGNDWFLNDSSTRGGAYNPATDNVVVVSRTGGLKVYGLSTDDGSVADTLDVTGIAGGIFPLSEVAVTSDGQIFGANLILDGSTSNAKIYHWAAQDAAPTVVYDDTLSAARYGDGIGVSGSGDAVTVYLSGSGNEAIAAFTVDGTALSFDQYLIPEAGTPLGRFGIAPTGSGTIWLNAPGTALTEISAEDGSIVRQLDDTFLPLAFGEADYFEVDGGQFLVTGSVTDETLPFSVIDVTTPGSERIVDTFEMGDVVTAFNSNSNGAGFVSYGDGTLYLMATNNAISSVALSLGYERTVRETIAAPGRAFMRVVSSDGLTVSIEDDRVVLPSDYQLSANYPNPFNPTTTFSFTLPIDKRVSVKVYDITGRLVSTLVNDRFYPAGTHDVTWNGTNQAGQQVASGTYLYTLEYGTFRQTRKMVLIK